MSRTPASYDLSVVRGATWEDEFTYVDDDGVAIDLTGYEARMQVRTLAGRYGTTTATTLIMDLTTANGRLEIVVPPGGTVPNQVKILVDAADTEDLNPDNERKVRMAYGLELFLPAGVDPEYVIPMVEGKVTCHGEIAR